MKPTYTHYVHTYWCHEDGLYTSLNPLRNNPLVEGVNTEAARVQTDKHTHDNYSNPRTCGPRVDKKTCSSVAVMAISTVKFAMYFH